MKFLHHPFGADGIIVQKEHVPAPAHPDPGVHRPAEACVPVIGPDLYLGKTLSHEIDAPVIRTVVNQDGFKIPVRLLSEAAKIALQPAHSVQVRDHNCNVFHLLCILIHVPGKPVLNRHRGHRQAAGSHSGRKSRGSGALQVLSV